MSLWAESLSYSCSSAKNETERIQEILRYLSMPVPLSWWQSCLNDERQVEQFAEILYEICGSSNILSGWGNYGLFVALAFSELESTAPYKYSIQNYLIAANDILKTNIAVNKLGQQVDLYLSKKSAYGRLVSKRKKCSLCQGLENPSCVANGQWDSNQIGPWTLWQGNINAHIMIIGQDWGDISYFNKWEGKDQPSGNPTNTNLELLLKDIGIEIEQPYAEQQSVIFLTNLILCLKTGGLQGKIENQWLENCSEKFLFPLINIIQPKVIISLGKKVCETIFDLYEISYSKSAKFSRTIKSSPFKLTKETYLFPMYHCGAGSINRNRSLTLQKQDWEKVNSWLKTRESKSHTMTEEKFFSIIEKYETAHEIIAPTNYEGSGSGYPFPRLHRAVTNQIEKNSQSVYSRYGIWATTVRDYITESISIMETNPKKAFELLKTAANNLSAFSEIQAELDPQKKRP